MGLIDELTRYCHNLQFHAHARESSQDSWSAANCPACGERCGRTGNRVRIWPQDNGGRGGWSCRICGECGDGIDLLRRYGVPYPDAYRAVVGALPPDHWTEEQKAKRGTWWTRRRAATKKAPERRSSSPLPPPPPVDMEAVAAEAARFHRVIGPPSPCALPPSPWRRLMTSIWREARENLLTVPEAAGFLAPRGIRADEAYLAGAFGWLPCDRFIAYRDVELPRMGAWPLPAGLLEVCTREAFWGTEVVGAAVHVHDRTRWPGKHMRAAGVPARSIVIPPLSASGAARAAELILLMEGALDALLAWQESGRAVLAVGVGAAGWLPDADADAAICAAADAGARIVLVPDLDEPGLRGVQAWRRRFPSAVVVRPQGGKDVCDAHAAAMRGAPGALTALDWLDRAWDVAQAVPAAPVASLLPSPSPRP